MNVNAEGVSSFDIPNKKQQKDFHFDVDPSGDGGFLGDSKDKSKPQSPPISSSEHDLFLHFSAEDCGESSPPTEVDFYKSPTILSRMILFQKYASANIRCRDHPEEASVWICSKRKPNKKQKSDNPPTSSSYALRQLPIHIAANSLAFTRDSVVREELERLMVRLVVTNPLGCSHCDHTGTLPLHHAIQSHASSPTISMLLMAVPTSIDQRDPMGHLPAEINAQRRIMPPSNNDNRDEVREMLRLGPSFWETSRQEAQYRLKHASITPATASVTSTSVLASSRKELDSVFTTDTANMDSSSLPKDPNYREPVHIESEDIRSTAWEQLEKRTVFLERILSEVYEQNYELTGLVDELQNSKQHLVEQLAVFDQSALQLTVVDGEEQQLESVSPPNVIGGDHDLGSKDSTQVNNLRGITNVNFRVQRQRKSMDKEKLEKVKAQIMQSCQHFARERRKINRNGRLSELPSLSSDHRRRHDDNNSTPSLVRSDSVVSELTEASFYDTSVDAVFNLYVPDSKNKKSKIKRRYQGARHEPEALGIDSLEEMFQQVAKKSGGHQGNTGMNLVDWIPTAKVIEPWSQPFVIASPGVQTSPMVNKNMPYNQQEIGRNKYFSVPKPMDAISPSNTDIVASPSTDIVLNKLYDQQTSEIGWIPPTATAEAIAAKKIVAAEVASLNTRNLSFIFNRPTGKKKPGNKQIQPHKIKIPFPWAETPAVTNKTGTKQRDMTATKEIILPGIVTPGGAEPVSMNKTGTDRTDKEFILSGRATADVTAPARLDAVGGVNSSEIQLPGFEPSKVEATVESKPSNMELPQFLFSHIKLAPNKMAPSKTDGRKEIAFHSSDSAEAPKADSQDPKEITLSGFGEDSSSKDIASPGFGTASQPSTGAQSQPGEICLPGFSPVVASKAGTGSCKSSGADRGFQPPSQEQSQDFLSFMNGMVFGEDKVDAKSSKQRPLSSEGESVFENCTV